MVAVSTFPVLTRRRRCILVFAATPPTRQTDRQTDAATYKQGRVDQVLEVDDADIDEISGYVMC